MPLAIVRGRTVERDLPLGLHGLIRAHAERTPQAVAAVDSSGTLTYAQLDAASDAVAAGIAAAGACPGDIVALAIPRGNAMLVALVGALKAGTPYLPLPLGDPPARIRALLDDAQPVATLVVSGTSSEDLPRPVPVDPQAVPSHRLPLNGYGDDHPVYVLYTSGSTGRPKGVVVPTLALANRLLWACERHDLGPGDRCLQTTPLTFDPSAFELLCPLLSGGQVVLTPPGAQGQPAVLIDWIERHGVTWCHFVPSLMTEFLRWPGVERCKSVRLLLTGAEVVSPAVVRQVHRTLPGVALFNQYGPTEATIAVTAWECPPEPERVLIGDPLDNCVLMILADDGTIARGDEIGELAIGGVQVATGYLNRPELTAAAFVPAPEGSGVDRVYKTGDLARITPAGLDFLGRRDSQLKLRGQRIEPAEIEDALRAEPWIADAAVAAVDSVLWAFIVPVDGDEGRSVHGLSAALRARLPEAYIPGRFAVVSELPVTPNGKRDRAALADRARAIVTGSSAAGPSDPLTRIWADALGSAPADPQLGFLDCGGHSLAAMRLCGTILQKWGTALPVTAFLRENLSLQALRARLPELPAEEPVTAVRADDSVSPEQRRLWLQHQLFPGSPAYNVVALLEVGGHLDPSRLRRAWEAVVARHEALRTTIVESGDGALRRTVHEPPVAAPLRLNDSDSLDDFAADLGGFSFDPARLPCAVLGLHRGPVADTLVLVADHLAADQQTVDLILADLAVLYADPGHASPVVQFAEAVAELRPQTARRQRDQDYWRRHLSPVPAPLRLPFSAERPARPSFRGGYVDADLEPELLARVRDRRLTPATAALAAFARVLADWSGAEEICVGVPASGRLTPRSQRAVGFFMRTLPLRLATPREAGVEELAGPVATALHEGIEHSSIPFDEIAALVGAPRDPGRNPVFQVWFNDLTHGAPPETFAGLPSRTVHPEVNWALFDLNLYLIRLPGDVLRLRLVYATDLWEEETARELLNQCRDALGKPQPQGLPAPMPARSEAVLPSVVETVLAQAESGPSRIAVTGSGGAVTYAALAERVRAEAEVAARAPAGLVAVRARRHADLAVAMLGCWLAGRAPLPLDEALPESWREVLRSHLPHPEGTGHALVTSGTTGRPAVVTLPTDALPEAFEAYTAALGLTENDVFCFTAPPAHDPMLRDLLLPLWLGATVHIPEPAAAHRPPLLAEALTAARPTILHLTPSQLRLLAATGASLPSVRHVVLHGEGSGAGDARTAHRLAPQAAIYDLYGATETPQAAHLARWEGDVRVPLPLPHRRVSVMLRGAPARPGVVGEIVISGRGLATGYVGAPDRVAPVSTPDGGRVYRTGDAGRRTLQGNLDIVGRLDRQVSLHGYRVELDGVEHALNTIAGVRGCAGIADGELAAWYAGDLEPDRLRGELMRQLPAWAVPARFVRLDELPLTANGKIDRAALPQTAVAESASRTPSELAARIAERATELVGERVVDPRTRFFDAGLTSLDLVRLRQILVAEEGLRLDIVDLFERPTPQDLAEHLAAVATARRPAPRRVPRRRSS